jgi:hypothetical protein
MLTERQVQNLSIGDELVVTDPHYLMPLDRRVKVREVGFADRLRETYIYISTLDGKPISGGWLPKRFTLPVTETHKENAMSSTTTVPLTREIAVTLPIGAVVIRNPRYDYNPGVKFTLDRPGIDGDGDFHGCYEEETYGSFQNWSSFDLPADSPYATVQVPASDLERVRSERDVARTERDAFKADLERVIDALRQEAQDRKWCSEYDSFMERLGFEARCSKEFTVRRRAYVEWEVTITATSEDDAREQVEQDQTSCVRDLDSDYLDLEDIEVVNVEEQ